VDSEGKLYDEGKGSECDYVGRIELCEDVLVSDQKDTTNTLIRQDLDPSTSLGKRSTDQRAESTEPYIHVMCTDLGDIKEVFARESTSSDEGRFIDIWLVDQVLDLVRPNNFATQNVSPSLLSEQFPSKNKTYMAKAQKTCSMAKLIYEYDSSRLLAIYAVAWTATAIFFLLGFLFVWKNGEEHNLDFSHVVDERHLYSQVPSKAQD